MVIIMILWFMFFRLFFQSEGTFDHPSFSTKMKTLSLLLLTSTVMAHPLRGADRFVEVRADDYTSANDAFSACTNDALIGAGSDKSLALACKMTPGCESLMDAAKSVEVGLKLFLEP